MKMNSPIFGAHKSVAGGLYRAFARGEASGCEAIQIFTKNQSQWKANPLDSDEIDKFQQERERTGMPVIAHAAYLPNLASPDTMLWEKSFDAMLIELQRCDDLGIPNLVFHPGSHTSDTRANGLCRIGESIAKLFDKRDFRVKLTIENTSGQGTNLGSSFEEIDQIIDISGCREKIAVCFDTCHGFAAGYDIRTKQDYENVWESFDRTIGLNILAAVHLNDSKTGFMARKDRHEHIGKGEIGVEGFRNLVNDRRFAGIPMLLETPKGLKTRDGSDIDMDAVNLGILRNMITEGK